jgi:hypothetical protein
MTRAITSEIVEGYSLCPRKAFLLLRDKVERDPHEYASHIEKQEAENRNTYRNRLLETTSAVVSCGPFDPSGDLEIIVDVVAGLVRNMHLGAAWTAPEASGLQSLVWRHRWEMTGADHYMHALLQYNREDCEALRLVTNAL